MRLGSVEFIVQLVAWMFALLEFVLALYILLLNVEYTANRHVSGLLLLLALNSLGLGVVAGATSASEAEWGTFLLAGTGPAIVPALLLVAIVLLKPEWMRGRWRWARWSLYVFTIYPIIVTVLDVSLDTGWIYTGLTQAYKGGYAGREDYMASRFADIVTIVNRYVMGTLALVPLGYIAIFDRKVQGRARRLAQVLLAVQILTIVIQVSLSDLLPVAVSALLVNAIFVLSYGYAAFRQMLSERRARRGRLQFRLTALVVAITVPALVAVSIIARTYTLQVAWIAVAVGTFILVVLTFLAVWQALRPVNVLTETAVQIAEGDLTRVAPVESEDEIGVLARSFNTMTGQLRELIGGLEQSVDERTADLERRSSYLEAASEVSRAAASILDPDELIQRVVELIRERFSLYYVGLFLVDEAGRWAVLRAGTGTAGGEMLSRGHRLEVGGGSMIGRCVGTGQADVQLDVGEAAVRFDNPLLPETRSELALPLHSRERTIGAMTVQSAQGAAFDRANVAVLQTMADQVALAIDNARLLRESTRALEEVRRTSGQLTTEAWTSLLHTRPDWGYRYVGGRVVSIGGDWAPEMSRALQTEQTVSTVSEDGHSDETTLAVPLRVRDQTVGVLGFRRRDGGRGWTAREIEVLELLVDQLGEALVSAQLYEAAQDSAAREQLVGELATRMRQTLDVEAVLRTAAQEVRQALDLPEVVVRLRSVPGGRVDAKERGERE